MLKRQRQKKILNLIRAKRIGTQEALRAHLERSGVPATQSSVSRDLEELGVIKHRGSYALPHTNGDATRGLLSLDVAGEVLVVLPSTDKPLHTMMQTVVDLFRAKGQRVTTLRADRLLPGREGICR